MGAGPTNFNGQPFLPSNMTCKKDSGYGSQGQLKLEMLRLTNEGNLKKLNNITKDQNSFDNSDASETDSPSSGFSVSSPSYLRPVIIPKEEKDLAEFYDRLNLQ